MNSSLLANIIGAHILADTHNSNPTAMSAIESALIQGLGTWKERELFGLAEELNIEIQVRIPARSKLVRSEEFRTPAGAIHTNIILRLESDPLRGLHDYQNSGSDGAPSIRHPSTNDKDKGERE